MIVTQDRPALVGYDQEAWTSRFGGLDPDPHDTIDRWQALRRANQVARAGGVAWLIEGDDKTRLERGLIEKTLKKRGQELEATAPASDRPTDRRGPDQRRDDPHRDGPRRDGPRDDRGKMTR